MIKSNVQRQSRIANAPNEDRTRAADIKLRGIEGYICRAQFINTQVDKPQQNLNRFFILF